MKKVPYQAGIKLHPLQLQLVELAQTYDFRQMTLQEIGALIGVIHRQKVKHHLERLYKYGLLEIQDYKITKTASNVQCPVCGGMGRVLQVQIGQQITFLKQVLRKPVK